MLNADVVVIGGGFAGLSAAVRLLDAGKRVVVVEASGRLGGRASTFADPESGEPVDNGQHVLFGCYRETYAFLNRLGSASSAPLDRALAVTMAGSDGLQHPLACPPLPWPWHLAVGVMRWRAIPLPDRVAVVRLANALRRGRFNEPVADATATRWLESQGQSASVRRWLWNPLAFAALNQSPDEAAAAPFVRVLKELIGTRLEDSAIGLPIAPLDDMLAIPAAREIAQLGGQILNGRPARVQLDTEGAIAGVTTRDATIRASTVVSAVPWHALAGLWERGCPPPLAHIAATAERMSSSPIVTVNLWFDRQVLPQRFVGLPDGAVHWVFDKQAIFGGRAGHLTAVASGASELAVKDQDEITAIALGDLNRAVPGSRPARLLRSLVVRERRATFSLVPGQPPRPATRTPLAGFFLAGDWIDTGLPATIESAVRSGHAAAEAVLDLAVRRAG